MLKNINLKSVPSWLPWFLLVVAALFFLRKKLSGIARFFGFAKFQLGLSDQIKSDTVTGQIDAQVNLQPDNYKTLDGVVYTGDVAVKEATRIYESGFRLPDGWYEDEELVLSIFRMHTQNTFPLLRKQYNAKYSRSLEKDCRDYLSAEQFNQIQYFFV